MTETDQESRLRRFLATYERLCKKYSLIVEDENVEVYERFEPKTGYDYLPQHLQQLKEGGINA